jgi:hypothetical protein
MQNILTNLNPKFATDVSKNNSIALPRKKFNDGQLIYVKLHNNDDIKWKKGKIVNKVSDFVYNIEIDGRTKTCHIDHIRKCDEITVQKRLITSPGGQMSLPTPRTVQAVNTPVNVHFPQYKKSEKNWGHFIVLHKCSSGCISARRRLPWLGDRHFPSKVTHTCRLAVQHQRCHERMNAVASALHSIQLLSCYQYKA